MKLHEKIDLIYKKREILRDIFHSENNTFDHNRVFFDCNDDSYIGIEQGYMDVTCKVIFIDYGIWQYNYITTQPYEKKYISLDEYLDKLIKKIKDYDNDSINNG